MCECVNLCVRKFVCGYVSSRSVSVADGGGGGGPYVLS